MLFFTFIIVISSEIFFSSQIMLGITYKVLSLRGMVDSFCVDYRDKQAL